MSNPEIYITQWGSVGPRVVLVHGGAQGTKTGGDHHFSTQQVLSERGWQLIVPDRPGHGRSADPSRPDDAEIDGEWVAKLLEDGAHLVGHSFGGCVALAAATRRPAAVRSLTLIEPGMQKLATDNPDVRKFGLKLLTASLFSMSGTSRARKFMKVLGITPEVRGDLSPDEIEKMGRALAKLRVPAKDVLLRELGVVKQAGIPLLVVTGGWSPAFEVTADAVAAAGGGDRQVIKSPHHFPQLVSDEFNQVLATFMTAAGARQRT